MKISAIYGMGSLVLFSKSVHTRGRFTAAQIIYVVMINVVYIVIMRYESVDIPFGAYITGPVCSIIIFIIVKAVIFSINKKLADEINEALKRKRETS